jgi:nucleoid DNA-binding protein
LIPKSHKIFIKPTAEELSVSETLVEDVVEFFYSDVRRTLNELKSFNVKIDNLGTFKIKEKELGKLKSKLEGHLKALEDPESFNQMRIRKDVKIKYDKIRKVSELINAEKERKKEHKKTKHEKNQGNLEK